MDELIRIDTKEKGWQKKVTKLMKKRIAFIIVTQDPNFLPDAKDLRTARKWVYGDGPAIAGGGAMVAVGGTMIILAFIDPEPTSKLAVMVVGGTILVFGGGSYMFTIAVMRRQYSFRLRSTKSGLFEWEANPAA